MATDLNRWVEARLRAAKASLKVHGIPRRLLRSSIQIDWLLVSCAAFVVDGESVIHVSGLWARSCRRAGNDEDVEAVLRHELGHLLCARRPDLRRAFRIPAYDHKAITLRYLRSYVGLMDYADVHPEEAFCDRLARLSPRTLRKVVTVLSDRPSRRRDGSSS